MDRGRDSTSVDARSPRLAITLRGLKILGHPKTRPELWGVVAPWVRVHTMGQGGTASAVVLSGVDQRPISPSFLRSWPIGSMGAGYVIRRMVERARRDALRTGDFDIVDEERVTTIGKIGMTFLAAMCVGMFAFFGIHLPLTVLRGLGQNPLWFDIVCACVAALMFIISAAIFGGMAWLWIRIAWIVVPSLRVTGVQIEMTTRDGRKHTYAWTDARRFSSQFVHVGVKMNDGRRFLVLPRRSRFVFQDRIRRQDPAAVERNREGALLKKMFWWFQGGGIVIALAVWWMNASSPGPVPHHPLVFYAAAGFGVPALLAFSMLAPNAIARWDAGRMRKKRIRGRSPGGGTASANPAG